jgi:hypothetical protein
MRQSITQRIKPVLAAIVAIVGTTGLAVRATPAKADSIVIRGNGPTIRVDDDYDWDNYYDRRFRDRIIRGDVEDSILLNPVLIDSEIEDSTLINPVIIDSPRYGNRRVIINSGTRRSVHRSGCFLFADIRAACQ